MDRAELERLERDALIERALAAGIVRARILTRPELIDELILRGSYDERTKQRARGFFGRARDLLTKVIEKGLNLPDAGGRFPTHEPPASIPPGPPLPTVTLAGIYAAQGHREKAVATLRDVLTAEPEHKEAEKLLRELDRASYVPPPPPVFTEDESAATQREDEDVPETLATPALAAREAPRDERTPTAVLSAGNDICAVPVDAKTVFVCWHVDEPTLLSLRKAAPNGGVTIRVVTILPTWDGPQTTVRDIPTGIPAGERLLTGLEGSEIVRVALGFRDEHGFMVITHSPALELPRSESKGDGLLRWTPVGLMAIHGTDPDHDKIAHAVERARARVLERETAELA